MREKTTMWRTVGMTGALAVALLITTSPAAQADAGPMPTVSTSSVASDSATTESTSVSLRDSTAPRQYRFSAAVPPGGRLAPVSAPAADGEITSEIMVLDAAGRPVGAYDAAWASDADLASVPTSYRIDGTTLIQTVDFSAETKFPVAIAPIYSPIPARARPGASVAAVAGPVTVPSNYVYNPSLGSLHDYCTSSPDEFNAVGAADADFRGPCARHDLCYERPGNNKRECDDALRVDLKHNCHHWYAAGNPQRNLCDRTAEVYWVAVTSFGNDTRRHAAKRSA